MCLDKFFNPQSVAIIGATENEQNITSAIFNNLFEMGYKGTIAPVNPHHDKVFGMKCYPSILDCKDNIDLSIIAVSSDHVPEILNQHIKRGIKNVIILSGGFAETGSKGIVLEEEVKRLSRENCIRIIGPNCIGVLDNYSNFSTFFLPWSKVKFPSKGHLSILSQSGSYAISMLDMLALEGIGVTKFVSYGNRADVGESELIEYLTRDDSTKVIGIYMESVDDGRRFIRVSSRCSRDKHMVVLKVGRRDSGINAARSHTGAIAGRYEIYKAAFKKSGILEVNNLEEFVDACKVLLMQKPARGNKILILTNGGGFGVAVSDACSVMELNVAQTPSSTKESLSKHFPDFFILNNPIDLTGSAGDEDFGFALKTAFVDNDFYDAAIIIPLMPPPTMTEGVVGIISQRARESGKPVVICTIGGAYTKKIKELFESKDLPVYLSPERAVKAMNILVREEKWMVVETSKNREAEKIVEKILASGRKVALPDESLAMVKLFGVDVPDYALVKTAEEAVEVSKKMGFPLVLKIASQDVLHKSDIGGVVINVENAQEVERNYHKVLDNLKRAVPDALIGGVLIQKQLPEATHLIVGGVYDEQFGPAVMFGLGGVFVELFKDVSFRIAPVTETEAMEMIKEIKAYPVLSGYRGTKKLDIEQVSKTIINISELITNISIMKEVELNPLFAYEKSVKAVDARVILK